ncbi:hypothetical protein [Aureivirga marina]|uniref:hypothetical protein n=1 Tax=Aureivirga marina TaxID=1182451 RepID=UPI0018CB5FA2|nr:hypothetical protein [Aureivirga marina]
MKKLVLICILLSVSHSVFAQNTPSFKFKNNKQEKIFYEIKFEKQDPITKEQESITKEKKTNNLVLESNYINEKDEYIRILDSLEKRSEKELGKKAKEIKKLSNFGEDYIKKMKEYNLILEQVKFLKKEKDSISNTKKFNEKQFHFLSFGKDNSKAFYDIVYSDESKQFSTLTKSGITIGNQTGGIFSEIVNGRFGAIRAGIGLMVSSSSKENELEKKENEAYQKLISEGGNTVLKLEYPVAFYHSKEYQFNIISRLKAKGSADFKEFGSITEDWAGSFSYGIDLYTDIATDNQKIRFFGYIDVNHYFGTDEFNTNLKVTDSNFLFGQITLGVMFNNVKLSVAVATFSSEEILRNRNVVLGSSIMH